MNTRSHTTILPSAQPLAATAHYKWTPLIPLSDKDRKIDLAGMPPLYETWHATKEQLRKSSPGSLKDFNQRLVRRLSVETGILERIYDLDRGTTEALIAHGFVEELVSRSSTDIEPSRLIDILSDRAGPGILHRAIGGISA